MQRARTGTSGTAGEPRRRRRRLRASLCVTAAAVVMASCVPEAPPSTTTTTTPPTTTPVEPVEVHDAQLSWAYNRYAQDGALSSWSQVATGDDVVINWADGQSLTGDAQDAGKEFMFVQFDGGEGSIDPTTGEGAISWETGDWTLNAYQGSFGAPDETLSDPVLEIEADGSGSLSFEVSVSGGLDGNGDPSPAAGPERHTAVTFDSLDELGAAGLRATGDFSGREYTPGEGASAWFPCVEAGVVTGGSWPADWVDFIPLALRAHYYSTGCGGKQPAKAPAPFRVRWDAEAPAISRQPTLSSTSFALGATLSPAGATVAFTGSPTPTIQWQRSVDGATWTDVVGAVGSRHTLPLGAADNGARLRAVLDNGVGEPVVSNVLGPITVAVTATSLGAISPSTAYTAPGGTATFAINVNGSPVPTVQWERSTDGGTTWSTVDGTVPTSLASTTPRTGGIRATLVVSGLQLSDHNTRFRLRASNGVGPEVVSNPATLSVQFYAPILAAAPASAAAFQGQAVSFSPLSVSAQPAATFQWEVSTDGGATWSNWSSATAPGTTAQLNLKPADTTAALHGAKFRLRATNAAGVTTSAAATLTLVPTTGHRRIVLVSSGPFDRTQPITFTALAEGLTPPAGVTSDLQWLVTHSTNWQPGQPINTSGAVFTELGALGSLIGNSDNNGMMRRVFSFGANTFPLTTGEYGVAIVGTTPSERAYDTWTPIELLTPGG